MPEKVTNILARESLPSPDSGTKKNYCSSQADRESGPVGYGFFAHVPCCSDDNGCHRRYKPGKQFADYRGITIGKTT
ncbi:hypothetical protein [uncultured Desulfobacter sp.]|uniref:hypothetical protein n=1 Tax=uncultured Desulfobacter sp. TaxID=240139 RepID=UPI0029F58EFE|nr:hypothetical protein [uncultured Desulfobacter sp.]